MSVFTDPAASGQYLVEVSVYIGGQEVSGAGMPPFADVPFADPSTGSGSSVGEVTLTYADRHWIGDPLFTYDFMVDGTLPDGASLAQPTTDDDGSYTDVNGVIQYASGPDEPRWTYDWEAPADWATLAFPGDSTTAGRAAQGTAAVPADNFTGNKVFAVPDLVAGILAEHGYNTSTDSQWGLNLSISEGATLSNVTAYNPQIVYGAGWVQSGHASMGGRLPGNSTDTSTMELTTVADTTDVEIGLHGSSATAQIQVDGGTTYTVTGIGSTLTRYRIRRLTPGVHTIKVWRTAGTLYGGWIRAWNAKRSGIEVFNWGFGGGQISDLADVGNAWRCLPAMTTVAPVMSCLNDLLNDSATDVATYQTKLDSIITTMSTSCHLLAVPNSSSKFTSSSIVPYRDAIHEVAGDHGWAVLDLDQRWGGEAAAAAAGFYGDGSVHVHPGLLGYADIAQAWATVLLGEGDTLPELWNWNASAYEAWFDAIAATRQSSGWVLGGLLNEPAETQAAFRSRTFSNTGAWNPHTATVGSATGRDGATKDIALTDSSGAATQSVTTTLTIANDGATHALRVFIPKTAAADHFPAVLLQASGGTARTEQVVLNTDSGVGTAVNTNGTFEITDEDDWWGMNLTITNNSSGNTSLVITLKPAASSNGTSLTNGAQGATSFDFLEAVLNADAIGSPLESTGSATVTRSATVVSLTTPSGADLPDGNYDVAIVRADGTESHSAVAIASGSYDVPTSLSPLQSVTLTALDAIADSTYRPNVYYEGRVTVPLVMERIMPLVPEESRRVQRQFGQIAFANGDGDMDAVVQGYAVDGRRVRVLFGETMAAYSSFTVIADVVATGWEADDLEVRLNLRDRSYSLDQPLQASLYTGAGGIHGTSDLTGKPIPLLFGKCLNVTPVLIDPTNLIYQVHDGAISEVTAVYDRGAALTEIADSPPDSADYATLVAKTVGSGEYATCLALGVFRLGSSPDGLVTADILGDADPSYDDTMDGIALRIIETRAGLSSSFVDAASFAAAASAATMGVYIGVDETPSTAEVLDALLASIGGYWGAGRNGLIAAGVAAPPEDQASVATLDQFDIVDLQPEAAPTPRWRQRVAYQRNWTVQRGEDLAGSITDTRRLFLTTQYRIATSVDTTVSTRHLQALDADPLATLLDGSTAAGDLADDLIALHGPDRRIYSATVKRTGYLRDLGQVVRLVWPRLGLANGKNFLVIGIRDDADKDQTVLRLWG